MNIDICQRSVFCIATTGCCCRCTSLYLENTSKVLSPFIHLNLNTGQKLDRPGSWQVRLTCIIGSQMDHASNVTGYNVKVL